MQSHPLETWPNCLNDKVLSETVQSAAAPDIAKTPPSIKVKILCHNDKELQQKLQPALSAQAAFQIKSPWRETISSWSARPFFSGVPLWSHFTSRGRDEVSGSRTVFTSTVNRDASFSLKPDLTSQMVIIQNCGQCITRRRGNINRWGSFQFDHWGKIINCSGGHSLI